MSAQDRIERVIASTPNNAAAARVVSQGGEHWDAKVQGHEHWFENPPPTVAIGRTHFNNPSFVDFRGTKIGRLTIIGLSPSLTPNQEKARWVARCTCGGYTLISAKAIRRTDRPAGSSEICCPKCAYLEHAKRKYKIFGGKPIEDFAGAKNGAA